MAIKSFNRTVEAINDLLDKLDNLPDYPLVFKGGLNNPSYLPSEATQGDLYLVMYANNDNTGLANSLYYRTHTNQWDIIANISYTKAQIDDKLDNIADNAELSTYTAGAGTSFETVATTDTVTDAIEKVQNNALFNKNNISSLTPALVECVDNGAKNKFNPNGTPSAANMVYNGDGTYTVTKTTTGEVVFMFDTFRIDAGTYILSGCPANGGASTIIVDIRRDDGALIGEQDLGTGATVTIPSTGTYRLSVRFGSDYTASGLVIKPMLCDPALWAISHVFKPYAPSNRELYEMILAMQ